MIARAHHLNDDRLLDRYLAERAGELPDPPVAEHLADCAECAVRYDDLVRFLDGVREEAESETDAIFTPDRLRLQQQQIARRLEHVGRAARIISFPGRLVGAHMTASSGRRVTRWAYAAAAACLVVGVGIGAWYDSGWRAAQRARAFNAAFNTARPARIAPVATAGAQPAPDAAADEAFLSDLELALERPRTRELLPFDALTPHVREISDRVR